jgi:hypothetical protein
VYEDADAKKAGIREGRYDKPGLTPKPKHYNQGARPKTSADVDPGA